MSDSSTAYRTSHPRPAVVGLAAFVFAALLGIAGIWRVHGGDATGPYLIGATSTQTRVPWPMPVKIYPHGVGFDGQYFLMLAIDPFLRTPMAHDLDRPAYRVRRIAVPFLAWATAAGNPRGIVWTLHVWSWIFVALGAWGAARWASRFGASPWWGMVYAVSLGVFITIWRVVGDAWAASALILLLLFEAERRPWLTGAMALLLLLCKETMVLAVAAVGAAALLRRDWRTMLAAVLACAAAGLWYVWGAWAARNLQNFGETLFNFSWPIIGPFKALVVDLSMSKPMIHKIKDVIFVGAHILSLGAGLAIGAWTIREASAARWRQIDAAGLALGFYSLMAFFFSFLVWDEVWAYGRILLPLPVMGLLWGLAHRGGAGWERRIALAALAAGVLLAASGLGFAALQILRATP